MLFKILSEVKIQVLRNPDAVDPITPPPLTPEKKVERSLKGIANKFKENNWNCKAYLRQNPNIEHFGSPLYSGRSSDDYWYIIKGRKTKRTPKDMPARTQTKIDNYFQEKFGFRAREFGTFVTGSYRQANDYGSGVFVLYPIGPFRFVWSNEVEDLYSGWAFNTKQGTKPFLVNNFLDSLKFSDQNLPQAIASNNEIVLVADRILAIDYKDLFSVMLSNEQLRPKFIKILKGEV